MLFALYNDKLVHANDQIDNLNEFKCVDCDQRVALRRGSKKIAYFAHLKNNCTFELDNESTEHLTGKMYLKEIFSKYGNSELEVFLPAIKQRADVLVTMNNGKKLAIEYQCSEITKLSVLKRTNGYAKLNIKVLWILGPKYLSKNITKALIGRFNNAYLVFLKENHNGLIIKYNFRIIDFKKITYQAKNFSDQELFVKFVKDLRSGKFNSLQPIIKNNFKLQTLKINQALVKNKPEWVQIQKMCYVQKLNLAGAPWICHPKTELPPYLKEFNIMWRVKCILKLNKLKLGVKLTVLKFKKLLAKCGSWVDVSEEMMNVCVSNFINELIDEQIIVIKNNMLINNRRVKWFSDADDKIN